MIKNKLIHYGFILAIITLSLFLGVYFLYKNNEYYSISVKVNAFILPTIYTFFTVFFLYKKSKKEKLTFSKSFKYSFVPMFLGGTFSLMFIIFFFNYIDKDAQSLLQNQMIKQNIDNLNDEYKTITDPTKEQTLYYHQLLNNLNSTEIKNESFFNLKKSFTFLVFLYSFYTLISLLLSIFFRTRNSNATINSNPTT